MSHSVEQFYKKAEVLHQKALELHRERYRVQGSYDEIACKSLGVNPTNTKLTAFAIGAMFGGFAGSFFATRQAFISPESFTFIESAIIVAIVVLGGMGSQTGVVLASIFLIGITEMFRDLEQYRMIAFGGAMVLIMVFRPKGILAKRKPTIRMVKEK